VPYLFVYGGTSETRDSISAVHCLDLDSFHWRKVWIAEVPPARDQAAVAVFEGHALIFGGRHTPTNHRYADFWKLDLSGADFRRDSMPSQRETVGGAVWRELEVFKGGPSARDATPFAHSPSNPRMIYLYGGRTGFTGEPNAELWVFDGFKWTHLDPKGAGPGPRAEHAFLPTGPDHLSVVGGIDGAGQYVPDAVYLLDLGFGYWSQPHVAGDIPRPKRGSALSGFVDGWAVHYGGDLATSIYHGAPAPELVVFHHPELTPQPAPKADADGVGTKASGVGLHMGTEMALSDAEALLTKAKEEVLRLETKVHAVTRERENVLGEIREAEEKLIQQRSDISASAEEITDVLQRHARETALTNAYRKLVETQTEQLAAFAKLEHRYRSVVASGEALRIYTDEIVRDSVVQDELDSHKEHRHTLAKHHRQLKALAELDDTKPDPAELAPLARRIEGRLHGRDGLEDLRVGDLA
jgi:hypothetical protein